GAPEDAITATATPPINDRNMSHLPSLLPPVLAFCSVVFLRQPMRLDIPWTCSPELLDDPVDAPIGSSYQAGITSNRMYNTAKRPHAQPLGTLMPISLVG